MAPSAITTKLLLSEPSVSRKKRALLDTNIWRYIVDDQSQGRLLRAARNGSYAVQIAPAVLYETLRLGDASLRASLVRLMTDLRFHRLMPEVYSESIEILRQIERIRPQWLRDAPDYQSFNRLKKDWTRTRGGFWVRCARSPETGAAHVSACEGEMMETARVEAHSRRKHTIEAKWKYRPMNETFATFDHPVPGWRGEPVEAWRTQSWMDMSAELAREGGAYRDWIRPFVDLDHLLLNSPAWLEFWLYLVDKQAVPRQWMRWRHSFAQRFRKVTPGSTCRHAAFHILPRYRYCDHGR